MWSVGDGPVVEGKPSCTVSSFQLREFDVTLTKADAPCILISIRHHVDVTVFLRGGMSVRSQKRVLIAVVPGVTTLVSKSFSCS
jgi:hypothetical protein